jgi:hypothetical protein
MKLEKKKKGWLLDMESYQKQMLHILNALTENETGNMQSSLRDVLTDLRHIAKFQNLDFNEAVSGSEEVFKLEIY